MPYFWLRLESPAIESLPGGTGILAALVVCTGIGYAFFVADVALRRVFRRKTVVAKAEG